jgi:hypothetical protein
MSLADWWWLIERYEIMTFVTIMSNTEQLMWTPKNLEIDIGLFVRPFSPVSWVAILTTTVIITICIFMTQYAIPTTEDAN